MMMTMTKNCCKYDSRCCNGIQTYNQKRERQSPWLTEEA